DLFSLGVVLFELVTGHMPFEGASATEIVDRILHESPPPVSRYTAGVPAALDAAIARALEKELMFRYRSAREMYTSLRDVDDALRNLTTDAHLKDSLAIDIGRRLGATWVAVGGFQRIGTVVRITASFVEVASGEVRRTVKVDGRIDDIFALQDKIVFELSQ